MAKNRVNSQHPKVSVLLPATSADDPSLIITLAGAQLIIKVLGHQHRWLAGGYDLEIL